MDEFDVYDDLDDQTLAALDQIEKNYHEKRQGSAPSSQAQKRQKTDSGWRPATAVTTAATAATTNSAFDLDELPEISLCQNSYTFQQLDSINTPSSTPQAQPAKDADHRVSIRASVATNSRNIPKPQPRRIPPPPPPPPPQFLSIASKPGSSKPPANRNQLLSKAPSIRPRNPRLLEKIASALAKPSLEPSQVPRNAHPPAVERVSVTPPPSAPHIPEFVPLRTPPAPRAPDLTTQRDSPLPAAPRHVPVPANLNEELDQFKKQLEEMRLENERVQIALREAQEAHTAKVGEVAVLRRGIQKTAEDHATQISKLKAAKDEADAKQASMQRDLKEEMERLRTQFIFKQHELESSYRKAPMSARRTTREITGSTQSPFGGSRAVGPSVVLPGGLQSTPVRLPTVIRPQFRSPEKTRKSAMLPGFENSFLESTPKRPPGKEKAFISPEIHRPLFADEVQSQKLLHNDVSGRTQSTFPDDGFGMDVDIPTIPKPPIPKGETRSSPAQQGDEDAEMADDEEEDEDEDISMEGVHFNWKAELTRVVLTHIHPSHHRPTLQLLAEHSTSVTTTENYCSQISRILEVIASTFTDDDYDRAISAVARCLISISFELDLSNLISPLIPVLNLLSSLIYSLPSFNAAVLRQCCENDSKHSSVLLLMCNLITQRLTAEKRCTDTPILAAEILSLAESLCWRTPEEGVEKLTLVAQNQDVVMSLIHSSQPLGFLVRATRLLVFMSIYPHLAYSLLSLPVPVSEEESERVTNLKNPQLDRLCSFLIDTNRQGEESAELKENVLTLFTVLSQTHPDALAALTSSSAVIPSLILYLTHTSSPIWEEDQSLISSPSSISSVVKSLNRTTYLLHYLVFRFQPEITLKSKLQHAPHRWFNGIAHMFIVTFGRLSYAPIPEWMESQKKYELSAVRDVARELLELVVPGPEGDSVYKAYHDDEEEDEGDMEEQLLGDA
ncbi:hypothetical protein GYMLUDRAFT_37407 [Collybiopsis luxurians FD-317 M1]|nr:hypothetical protein GYMLUDRAFT_37407 [Collybiopsis luxurians FD-317 M1]